MKQLSWEEYYDGFYDWSTSTQKRYAGRLSGYGPAEEVWEIAQELECEDGAFAAKFVEKAFAGGVRFTPEQVLEMTDTVDKSLLGKIAGQTAVPFDRDQLEEIYLLIDDSSFERISRRAGIDIFEDEEPDFGLEDGILSYHSEKDTHPAEMDQEAFAELARRVGIDAPRHQEPPSPPRDKPGFFTLLAAALTGVSLADRTRSQERRCNGDCANCPPHYGYRHGRWYYGKGHQYGCEFGGNKGDGSLD